MERMRAGIRSGWNSSQVETDVSAGHDLLITRNGVIEDGKLQSVWVTARDITALKQAEAEVMRLERRAEEPCRSVDCAQSALGTGQRVPAG